MKMQNPNQAPKTLREMEKRDPGSVREALTRFSDRDLLNFCIGNKEADQWCKNNDLFFEERILLSNPRLAQFKSPERSWRNFYLSFISVQGKNDADSFFNAKKKGDKDLIRYYGGTGDEEEHILTIPVLVKRTERQMRGRPAIEKRNIKYSLDMIQNGNPHGKGQNPNGSDEAPLITASEYGYLDMVKYLVEHGADIHANNDEALFLARQNGHHEVANYLVLNGARYVKDRKLFSK